MDSKERDRHLVSGITIVLFANIIGMFSNIILNFLLPKYLTIETYAGIKTYQLYCTYVGIFHFGYIDGIYLEYGGKGIKSLDSEQVAIRINTLRLIELIIFMILLYISFTLRDDIFFYFALSILPLNIIGFFQLFYQATGEYSKYSRILSVSAIMRAIISVLIIMFVSRTDYRCFLMGYVILDIIIWIGLERDLFKGKAKGQSVLKISIKIIRQKVKEGLALRIGVLSGFLLSGMDCIFVKYFMDTKAFALYAFAASVENLLNVMITPITTTLYNYFCNETNEKQIIYIRNIVMVVSLFMLLIYFPVKLVLNIFLNSYSDSLIILAFLFSAQELFMIVQGVYVNLYKAREQKMKYLYRLIMVIFIGILLNLMFYQITGQKESFAFATWMTTFIWLIFCTFDFKIIVFNFKEFIYLLTGNVMFLLCACFFGSVSGFLIFLIFLCVLSYIVMSCEMKSLFGYIKTFFNWRYFWK